MKRFKNLSLKKKRTLAIAGVSLLGLTIVGTIAYNQDSMFFANLFRLPSDVVEFSETFDSPDDWQPCQEIPKTAIATNKNATPRYVRMKINEYWRTKDTQTPTTDHETSDLPLTWDDNGTTKHYAVINTQNDDEWELKNDGWYYYKTTLAQNESTDSLLKSVTFNCEVNTVGEIRYTVGGTVGEGVPSDYAEANYHLYITFQMSDEDMAPQQHQADCDGDELYDIIACQSNGTDEDIDFNQWSGSASDPKKGVNTVYSHRNDNYPVHYFRGDVANNYLEYNGFCWRLVRTAEDGGVKMLYAGAESASGCPANNSDYGIGSGYFSSAYNSPGYTHIGLPQAGYMYDGEDTNYEMRDSYLFGRLMAKDVSWDGEKYTLINTMRASDPFNPTYWNNYSYYCRDMQNGGVNTTECEEVYYYTSYHPNDGGFGMRLTNGDKFEDAITRLKTNTKSSIIKTTVDTWFENNITAHRDALADVVYCNDRGASMAVNNGNVRYRFDGYTRILGVNNNGVQDPTIDCADKNDAFTVDNEAGNKALTYPIALITLDELALAGNCFDLGVQPMYNNNNRCTGSRGENYARFYEYWAMTPLIFGDDNSIMSMGDINGMYWGSPADIQRGYRPVLALKGSTEVTGTGTKTDPYRIKE